MDVEKTIEFILEQQAAMNVRQDSILTMIDGGMKLIAAHDRHIKALIESQERLTAAQQATDDELKQLAAAQAATDEKLSRLIDALQRNASNGQPSA